MVSLSSCNFYGILSCKMTCLSPMGRASARSSLLSRGLKHCLTLALQKVQAAFMIIAGRLALTQSKLWYKCTQKATSSLPRHAAAHFATQAIVRYSEADPTATTGLQTKAGKFTVAWLQRAQDSRTLKKKGGEKGTPSDERRTS